MKTTAKTNIIHGIKILGLGALLLGTTALVPAHADDWHRGRDHDRVGIDLRFDRGHVDTDFVFYGGPDRRPEGRFWVWDRHDHCWRRDHR